MPQAQVSFKKLFYLNLLGYFNCPFSDFDEIHHVIPRKKQPIYLTFKSKASQKQAKQKIMDCLWQVFPSKEEDCFH